LLFSSFANVHDKPGGCAHHHANKHANYNGQQKAGETECLRHHFATSPPTLASFSLSLLKSVLAWS
jgi:hypothetical protein